MRSFCSGIVALAIGLGLGAVPAWAQPRQVRFGLMAGNNLGHDSAHSLHYAEEEVGRLAELLKTAGDFDDIVTLRGATRGEIEKGLVQTMLLGVLIGFANWLSRGASQASGGRTG